MVEKIRLGSGEWTAKNWIAACMLVAMIIVFVYWGVAPSSHMGDASGGVAAVVNNKVISLAEYRNQVESVEAGYRQSLDGMPENARRAHLSRLRGDVLNQLVMSEAVYQAASQRGIIASDGDVKEHILQFPIFQENGRFQPERYRNWLSYNNMAAEDFENRIRKQVVLQKVQELFVGSAQPSREELKHNRALASQKVNLRYAEITREDLNKLGSITDAEVMDYAGKHKTEIEAFYKDNAVEYMHPEKYHARDIVIRIDEKRPEAEAQKLAAEVRKQVTAANFTKLAAKYNEDPGSKAKGGDLGERQRGSMIPEFEDAALALEAGKISEPVKIGGAFHVIWLESKKAASTTPIDKVEKEIARKLVARAKESEILTQLRQIVEKGDKKEIDASLVKAAVKWKETGDFDLASNLVPNLGDAKEILPAILEKGKVTGLVKSLIPLKGNFLVVEVTGWKNTPDSTPDVDGLEQMLAYKKSQAAIMSWAKEVEARASVQKNTRLLQ